jgi:hypothetical protein
MAVTPFMNLNLPVPTVTIGPDWAAQLNSAIELVDSHDHTSGKGVRITPSAMNINSDLDFKSNNIINTRSYRMAPNGSPISNPSDIRTLYAAGGELYYNDASGNQIQITAGGALNASTIGGIGGDYATSSASLFYTSVDTTYVFDQSTNRRGNIDAGDVTLRDPAAISPNGVTIESPTALGSDYTITLPTGTPLSLLPILMDTSGALSTAQIDTPQIADGAVTDSKISTFDLDSRVFKDTLTGSGTYVVPSGVTKIIVYVQAAGGGGGSGATGLDSIGPIVAGGGGGGGSAGQWKTAVIEVTPGQNINYSVGSGGVGGTGRTAPNTGGASGSAGGSTIFGGIACVGGNGGLGGNAPTTSPVTGGIGASGGTGVSNFVSNTTGGGAGAQTIDGSAGSGVGNRFAGGGGGGGAIQGTGTSGNGGTPIGNNSGAGGPGLSSGSGDARGGAGGGGEGTPLGTGGDGSQGAGRSGTSLVGGAGTNGAGGGGSGGAGARISNGGTGDTGAGGAGGDGVIEIYRFA